MRHSPAPSCEADRAAASWASRAAQRPVPQPGSQRSVSTWGVLLGEWLVKWPMDLGSLIFRQNACCSTIIFKRDMIDMICYVMSYVGCIYYIECNYKRDLDSMNINCKHDRIFLCGGVCIWKQSYFKRLDWHMSPRLVTSPLESERNPSSYILWTKCCL